MKIGDLKKALSRFPPDMDDTGIIMVTSSKGKTTFDLLAGVGYMPLNGTGVPALVGLTEIQRQVEAGKLEKPEGYKPLPPDPDDVVPGDEWKLG